LKGSTRLRYNLAGGRLQWVIPPLGRAPTLPSFKQLFANAPLGEAMKG
jgi:hypothetical protein